jgi:hypothetical protein
MMMMHPNLRVQTFNGTWSKLLGEEGLAADDDDACDAVCTCPWHLMPVWNLLCSAGTSLIPEIGAVG